MVNKFAFRFHDNHIASLNIFFRSKSFKRFQIIDFIVFLDHYVCVSVYVRLLLSFLCYFSFQNQVSWVRRRDWHILSSGDSLYTNDARFVATHEPTQSTYTLQIKFVQKRDHGIYEVRYHGNQS